MEPSRSPEPPPDPILRVRDLRVRFGTKRGTARVVNGLEYDLHAGETLAIVGESGSGKSVSVLSLMKLIPEPPGRIDGEAHFGGIDLLAAPERELREIRGNRIAMIFQDPMTSLNPVITIGAQLTEAMLLHLDVDEAEARKRAVDLLDLVGIPSAATRLDDYPHQFSGGMRQRVMIAMGLSCDPEILIADEATTALDVTTQAQIVELVERLQARLRMAVIWITHDLGVVASIADRVLVMYAGRIIEEAAVDDLYADPRHPYSLGLLEALPQPGTDRPDELYTIPGLPPDPVDLPPGCPFWDRCAFRLDEREQHEMPPLRDVGNGHRVACYYEIPEEARRSG